MVKEDIQFKLYKVKGETATNIDDQAGLKRILVC